MNQISAPGGLLIEQPHLTNRATVVVAQSAYEHLDLIASVLGFRSALPGIARTVSFAVELIKASIPELVICDVNLSGGGAAALCAILKSDEATADIPVLLTAESAEPSGSLTAALEAGADDFVILTFAPELIRKKLDRLIESHKQRKTLNVQYHSLLESFPALVYMAEPRPPYSPIYLSPNFESLGYSMEKWHSSADLWLKILHPDDLDRVIEETEAARISGRENQYEYRVFTRDGSIRWFHDRGRFVRDSHGRLLCWQRVIIDVTKRKEIEDALRESESRFRSLVETAASVIIALSRDGTITEWNREAERIYGHDREAVLGKNYFDLFIPPKLRPVVNAQLNSVLRGEPMRDFEITIRRPDGSRRIVLWNVNRQVDSAGSPTGLIAAGQDITERKNSEIALRASEERYRDVFENANDIIYTRDIEGRFTSINNAAERLTGFSRDEILKWNAGKSEFRRLVEWTNQQTIDNLQVPPHEVEVTAKDGRKLTFEVSNRLILSDGKPVGIQGIARDVTERRQLHLQLAQTEKLSALGQLVSGVAHELNNPLTSVIGHAQLLLRAVADAPTEDRLKVICKEGERARRIVQNLLSFSRQHNPSRSQVNINELIDLTLELRAYEMAVNNIVVSRELGEIPSVYGDEHQLQQVFLNILINAEQAIADTDRGGHIVVSTSVVNAAIVTLPPAVPSVESPSNGGGPDGSQPNARVVVIKINDNGPGIPPERIGRVFDPFFTTKPVGQGTGLGLSISYGIIQEHKGSIRVESTPSSGATFIIELPA